MVPAGQQPFNLAPDMLPLSSPGILRIGFKNIEPDIDRPDPEACLAIAEVILPYPAEALIEAQPRHLWPCSAEPTAPFGKGRRIAKASA